MKFCSWAVSGLISCALLFGATATNAQQRRCDSQLKGEDIVGTVVGISAVGEDLEVTIAWNSNTVLPPTAKIRVRAPGHGVVASQTMVPLEGDLTTTIVPGAFSDVVTHGLQYRIRVGGLIEPHDFRVVIDCPIGSPTCEYKLEDGVKSKRGALLDKELGILLAALGAIPDVLSVALATDPKLEGEIATLALELYHLDQEFGIPLGGCSCVWAYDVIRTPSSLTRNTFEGLPLEEGGFEGPGAAHDVGAQSVGAGGTSLAGGGTSRLEMGLQCWDFQGWEPMTVELPAGPVTFNSPNIMGCETPCNGEVQHQMRLEARLAALAVGGQMSRGVANATEEVDYFIDDDLRFNDSWTASVEAKSGPEPSQELLQRLGIGLSGSYETDVECGDRTGGQVRMAPTSAQLHTVGNVMANGDADAFGIAQTGLRYEMRATGFASCAVPMSWYVTLTSIASFAGEPVAGLPGKVTIQPYCWD